MREKIFLAFLSLILFMNPLNSQTLNSVNYAGRHPTGFIVAAFLPSPTMLIEDKKVRFGLSKELSLAFGSYAEHRFAFEYTYVFRDYNNSQLRVSYNYDLFPGYFFTFTVGGGYFNDLKAQGYFPQLSAAIIGSGGNFIFNIYAKARYTYVVPSNRTNIFDLSFGVGLGLAPFGSKSRATPGWK